MVDTTNAKRLREILSDTRLSALETAETLEQSSQGTVTRLVELFGVGDRPKVRRHLYCVIESIVERHGHKAQAIVAKVANQSRTKHHPDRWFCSVVLHRLAESGFQP